MAPGWGIFTELQYNPKVSFRLGVEYSGLGGKKDGMQAMPTQRLITEMGSSLGIMGITPEQEGAMEGFMMWSAMNPYYFVNVENTVKFDYVMIPVTAQFGWDVGQKPWRVYVNVGPFISFILSSKQISKGNSLIYDNSGEPLWNSLDPIIQGLIETEFPIMKTILNAPIPTGETNITGEMKSANFGVTGNIGVRYQRNRNYFFIEAGGNYGFFAVQDDDANGSNRLGAVSVMLGYAFSLF